MRRPRPHIPIEVKIAVAERQLLGFGSRLLRKKEGRWKAGRWHLPALLRLLSTHLGGIHILHLDHAPALRLRPYNPRIKNVAARYTPNANDPAALLYRTAHDHHIKTNVRGDGAQRPDNSAIKRERRREKPNKKHSRTWPKRKLQGRRGMDYRKFDGTPVKAPRERA